MSKKLVSFCVPSYNSAEYLFHALDSLIPGGDEIEVLIIDDGSKDKTLDIAKEYEKKYPNIFKAVHEENKGHGGAINNALSLASGEYFKVLDSDDWVKENGLKELLKTIREAKEKPDLILMPYTYIHGDEHKEGKTIRYGQFIKPNTIVSWNQMKRFDAARNLTLHSVVYKTDLLRDEVKLDLPEHCFYEDNYMIYAPLPYVKKILYIDEPLYQYLLGRAGQSMQTKNLINRNENLMRVSCLAFKTIDLVSLKKENHGLYKMMKHQLIMMTASPLLYTSFKKPKELAKKEKKAFIDNLKETNLKQYKMLHKHPYIWWPSINNWIGKAASAFMLWVIRMFGSIN